MKDKRSIPATKLTKKWLDQDVNKITSIDYHKVRMPNDFVDWSSLSSEVKTYNIKDKEITDKDEK